MIFVESSFEVFSFVGGPFDGEALLRPPSLPPFPAHCEGGDGLVHVYAPAGLAMLYQGSHQVVRFPAAKNEVSLMQYGVCGTSCGLVGPF